MFTIEKCQASMVLKNNKTCKVLKYSRLGALFFVIFYLFCLFLIHAYS